MGNRQVRKVDRNVIETSGIATEIAKNSPLWNRKLNSLALTDEETKNLTIAIKKIIKDNNVSDDNELSRTINEYRKRVRENEQKVSIDRISMLSNILSGVSTDEIISAMSHKQSVEILMSFADMGINNMIKEQNDVLLNEATLIASQNSELTQAELVLKRSNHIGIKTNSDATSLINNKRERSKFCKKYSEEILRIVYKMTKRFYGGVLFSVLYNPMPYITYKICLDSGNNFIKTIPCLALILYMIKCNKEMVSLLRMTFDGKKRLETDLEGNALKMALAEKMVEIGIPDFSGGKMIYKILYGGGRPVVANTLYILETLAYSGDVNIKDIAEAKLKEVVKWVGSFFAEVVYNATTDVAREKLGTIGSGVLGMFSSKVDREIKQIEYEHSKVPKVDDGYSNEVVAEESGLDGLLNSLNNLLR